MTISEMLRGATSVTYSEAERETVLAAMAAASDVLADSWQTVMQTRFWGVEPSFYEFFAKRGLIKYACDTETRNEMIRLMIEQGTRRADVGSLFDLSRSALSRIMTGADSHRAAKTLEREVMPEINDYPSGTPTDDHTETIGKIYSLFQQLYDHERTEVLDNLKNWHDD